MSALEHFFDVKERRKSDTEADSQIGPQENSFPFREISFLAWTPIWEIC